MIFLIHILYNYSVTGLLGEVDLSHRYLRVNEYNLSDWDSNSVAQFTFSDAIHYKTNRTPHTWGRPVCVKKNGEEAVKIFIDMPRPKQIIKFHLHSLFSTTEFRSDRTCLVYPSGGYLDCNSPLIYIVLCWIYVWLQFVSMPLFVTFFFYFILIWINRKRQLFSQWK